MQTFKTYEEIMQHYWGKIVPMAQAAGIKPWECVRHVNEDKFTDHPHFKGKQWHYTFAITILEGKPVFVGDKLYYKDTEFIVADCSEKQSFSNVTWTPPAKKRTFMLGDEEFSDDQISYIIDSIFERDGGYTTDLLRKLRQVRSKQNAL